MDYQHKSGAQKRKEKAARESKSVKGQQTLSSLGFGVKSVKEGVTAGSVSDTSTQPNDPVTAPLPTSSDHATVDTSASVAVPVPGPLFSRNESDEQKNFALAQSETSESTTNSTETLRSQKKLLNVDIGTFKNDILNSVEIENVLQSGHETLPTRLPQDRVGYPFPSSLLKVSLKNGESVDRDWLVWSSARAALFCLPCRLFCKQPNAHRSALTLPCGYSCDMSWKKLYDRIPEHESSTAHKKCYIEWREAQIRLDSESTVSDLVTQQIRSEVARWRQLLSRLLSVTLFLAERGLAFRGDTHLIGDPSNGNFLGLVELIAHYDPILNEHVQKVKTSQDSGRRMQAHYLSPESQNEFIACCADQVTRSILQERQSSRYYSIIVDSTPDVSHIEQSVFILRYVYLNPEKNLYEVLERFLEFTDSSQKTGKAIAEMITLVLSKHRVPIELCRGQGYDNGANMSGQYKGAQAHILKINPLATFSPCACHSLNLCGEYAANCCPECITFFGVVQNMYNVFSSSPQRWEILLEEIECSLHSQSETRWNAKVEAVMPFAANLPGLRRAVSRVFDLNLTPETRSTLKGIENYLGSFECILMASIWVKVLKEINYRNELLQAKTVILDVEVANIQSLKIEDLKSLRNEKWPAILQECKLVAESMGISPSANKTSLPEKRKRVAKRFPDEDLSQSGDGSNTNVSPEDKFKKEVFFVLLDGVIGNLVRRYEAAREISSLFQFLWKYMDMDEDELRESAKVFQEKYSDDVSEKLVEEILHLKAIHPANFGSEALSPLDLLNQIHVQKLDLLFANVCVALRIFCCVPVTVAQGERSFSTLGRVKNFRRSTMSQSRLNSLAVLAIENRLARKVDLESVIDDFANQKARKKTFTLEE